LASAERTIRYQDHTEWPLAEIGWSNDGAQKDADDPLKRKKRSDASGERRQRGGYGVWFVKFWMRQETNATNEPESRAYEGRDATPFNHSINHSINQSINREIFKSDAGDGATTRTS
jgi:hypothetical protein